MKKLLLIFFLLSSIFVSAQTTPTQPFVTMGLPPSPSVITPISPAVSAEKDISQLNEQELLAKIKAGVSDAEYQKIKSPQLTEKVRAEITDLAKLNAAELGKSFGFESLSLRDVKDIKYKDKKLLHPKGGSLAVEEAKGKQLLITGDKFIILEGKKGIIIDGELTDVKINKDGSIDAGKFGKINGKEELVLMRGDSPDALLTNAESLELKGKTVKNDQGAKFKTIVHDNGDFGVEVLEGKPVRVVHQLDNKRKIKTTVSPNNKYYAIDDNTKHGLQNGGTLIYTKGDKSHILTSDAHSIFVFDDKENLAKVIAGYETIKPVAATYEEKKNNLLLRRFDVKEGNGFTLYKESGLVSPKDPGIKIEEIVAETGITYDIDKKSLKGKLVVSTNGVDAFITPKGVTESIAIKRMTELYADTPETTLSVGKHEVTMSPKGDVDVGRDIFKTMAETIAPSTRKAPTQRRIDSVEDIEEGMSDWVVQDKPTGKEIARFNTKATVYWTCLEDDLGGYSSFEACVKVEGAGVREENGKLMLYKVEKGKIVSEELTEANKRGYRGPGASGTLDIGDIAVPKEIFDKYKGRIGWVQLTDGQWAKVRIADIGGNIQVREENGKKYYDLDLYVGNGASNADELGGLGKGSLVTRGTKGKYNQLIITDEVDSGIARKIDGVSQISPVVPQQKIPIGTGEYTSIADAFRDYGYEGEDNFVARKQVYESFFPDEIGKYRGTAQQNIKFLNTLRDNTRREQIEQLLPAEEVALTPRQQKKIVDNAQRFLDVPYGWGGIDESGIDCSGLVCRAYRGSGVSLPRTTANGYYNNYALRNTGGKSLQDIRKFTPGMACFWWNRDRTRISHTGIYTGNGEVIHASGNAGLVLRDSLTNVVPERFAGCHELST